MDGGSGSELDMARAEAQLELTRSTIPPLSEIKVATDLIAIYRALGGGWQVKEQTLADQGMK